MPHHKTFDLLTGYCVDKGELPGIRLWPANRKWKEANLRILCLGGSTTATFPDWQWPRFLCECLEEQSNCKPLIFNAAAAGYSSDQELLRLLRDGPGIQPHVVISLSGLNDIGFLHSAFPHPFTNPFQSNIAKNLTKNSPHLEGFSLGIPWKRTPAENWLRNARISKAVSLDLGSEYFAFLQPILGYQNTQPRNAIERDALKRASEQSALGIPYPQAMNEFYDSVRNSLIIEHERYGKYIFDISDCLENESDVWMDQRHQNEKGNDIIASTIAKAIAPYIKPQKSY